MTKSRRSPICPIRALKPSGDPQRHAGGPQNSCTPVGPFLKEPRLTAWTAGQPFTRHHGSAIPPVSLKVSPPAALLRSYSSNTPVPQSLHIEMHPDTAHALRYAAGCYLTRTCGRPEFSQAQLRLKNQASQRKLRSQVLFPNRRPPPDAIPARGAGRGNGGVRRSRPRSPLAKGDPRREHPRGPSQLRGSERSRSGRGGRRTGSRNTVPTRRRRERLGRAARTSCVCTRRCDLYQVHRRPACAVFTTARDCRPRVSPGRRRRCTPVPAARDSSSGLAERRAGPLPRRGRGAAGHPPAPTGTASRFPPADEEGPETLSRRPSSPVAPAGPCPPPSPARPPPPPSPAKAEQKATEGTGTATPSRGAAGPARPGPAGHSPCS